MTRVKQVIVVRIDLEMKTGKLASQVAHASMAFLSNKIRNAMIDESKSVNVNFSEVESIWLKGKFTQIILQAENEAQMLLICQQAKEAGISVAEIIDDGTTVFNGH
ncbi:MAG: peptidyl-tRNA hydrolase [Planctomycetaceae bacterium]|jgi:PTH2 family peptidyl-tRNA hydrolase|nr:peptidyl-tRNA hydrolase [Planctomycetaceae bacterium]